MARIWIMLSTLCNAQRNGIIGPMWMTNVQKVLVARRHHHQQIIFYNSSCAKQVSLISLKWISNRDTYLGVR